MAQTDESPLSTREAQEALKATFDILDALVVRNKVGRVVARAGWTIDLVFLEGDTLPVRERAWKLFELYCSMVKPEEMVFWWGGKPVSLTSKTAANKLEKLRHNSTANPKGFAMMFNMASGKPTPPEAWENNAQEFNFRCRIENEEGIWERKRFSDPDVGPAPSFIRMALPCAWMREQPTERNAGWLATQAVEVMQPLWATAGWGIVPAVEERNIDVGNGGRHALHPYLQRFPGLNALGSLALMNEAFGEAMFSVNWLSFVSDPLLERLGGREAVRQRALTSKYLRVADVGNCLAVRAGDFPALGDTERGISLPAFGEAARLFKDIRTDYFYNNFIGSPSCSGEEDHRLECDAYLRRFDLY
ncbi:DUF3396 domain-containing protein [Xanthomonas campestris pv. cannae]|nr:DUF3396 domain-containing protein [Xanthomonas campestris pv. cannae]